MAIEYQFLMHNRLKNDAELVVEAIRSVIHMNVRVIENIADGTWSIEVAKGYTNFDRLMAIKVAEGVMYAMQQLRKNGIV